VLVALARPAAPTVIFAKCEVPAWAHSALCRRFAKIQSSEGEILDHRGRGGFGLPSVAGATYWINCFRLFLALPIPYLPWVTLVSELSLALWLLVVGVNETKWQAQAGASAAMR
jgi:hypothetical protein